MWDAAAEGEPDKGLPPPPDEILEAYRSGRLSPDRASRLEALLASSGTGRRRLAELAGVAGPKPSATLREKVLAELVRMRCAPSSAEDEAVLVRLR